MTETGNAPMPDEPDRRVPARPAGRRDQDEPQPRSHPASGDATTGEVPEGGAVGPGPAAGTPAADADAEH